MGVWREAQSASIYSLIGAVEGSGVDCFERERS